jgi:hypothetical protein
MSIAASMSSDWLVFGSTSYPDRPVACGVEHKIALKPLFPSRCLAPARVVQKATFPVVDCVSR